MENYLIGHSEASVRLEHEIEQAKDSDFILLIGRSGMGRTATANYLHEKFWENKKIKPLFKEVTATNVEPILNKYFKNTEPCTLCINGAHNLTANIQELLINHFKNKYKKNEVKIILASSEKIKCIDNMLYSNYFCNNPVDVIKIPSLYKRETDIHQFVLYFIDKESCKHKKTYTIDKEAWTVFDTLETYKNEDISLRDLREIIEGLCLEVDDFQRPESEKGKILFKDARKFLKKPRVTTEEYDEDIDFWKQKNQQLNNQNQQLNSNIRNLQIDERKKSGAHVVLFIIIAILIVSSFFEIKLDALVNTVLALVTIFFSIIPIFWPNVKFLKLYEFLILKIFPYE